MLMYPDAPPTRTLQENTSSKQEIVDVFVKVLRTTYPPTCHPMAGWMQVLGMLTVLYDCMPYVSRSDAAVVKSEHIYSAGHVGDACI